MATKFINITCTLNQKIERNLLFKNLIYSDYSVDIFQALYAQESIHAKLIDSTTQKPIPFATIELNKKSGVISNENGIFQMYLDKKITKNQMNLCFLPIVNISIKAHKTANEKECVNPRCPNGDS